MWEEDSFNEEESGKLNFRFGANYNKRITGNLYFKTGLRFASIGFKGKLYKSEDFHFPNGNNKNDPSIPDRFQNIYDFWFIEIPLNLRYEYTITKLTPFIEFGISSHFFITQRIKSIRDDKTSYIYLSSNKTNVRKVQYVANISFGANYEYSNNFSIFFQPTARLHFTEAYKTGNNSHIFLYNYGIEFGTRIKV